MKPRWLRHMIPTPSPKPIPIFARACARALDRRCTCSKVSEPLSSTIAIASGCLIAAVVIPVAGEAPQRTSVVAVRAARSGRLRPRIPASWRTFTSKAASKADWRTLPAIELRLPMGPRRLFAIHGSNRNAGDSLAAPDPAHSLVARRLDADPGRGGLGEDALHLRPVGLQPGVLADDGGVDVDDPPADRADDGAQHVDRVGVAPALLVVGEERADVARAGRPEQRVDHRVGEHVGVGVAGEAELVLDLDTAQDQAAALGEAVAVVADPDAHRSILAVRGAERLEPPG